MTRREYALHMPTGKMTEIFLRPALLHGDGIWKACGNIVKRVKANHSGAKINYGDPTTEIIIQASIKEVVAFVKKLKRA